MKKYFYEKNKEQFGPVDFEVLMTLDIKRDTLIWYEGLNDWTKAIELDDLAVLFQTVPPPMRNAEPPKLNLEKENYSNNYEIKPSFFQKNKTNVFLALGILIIGSVLLISFGDNSKTGTEILTIENSIQLEEQQKMLEAQQIEIEKQKKENEYNQAKEKYHLLFNEYMLISSNLDLAVKNLNDVSGFKLLRSSSERNNQINEATENVEFLKEQLKDYEDQLKKINKKYNFDETFK